MAVVYPDQFLEVRVAHLDVPPLVSTLCSGFEGGQWRSVQLADHMFQWLPYAALNQEHQLSFGSHNFVEMLRLASAHIYNTKKTASRGELGELLLHLACILHFHTAPVMCKLILKSSSNDTVKGFDGLHVLPIGDSFELWLGESKFYTDPQEAIRDAVKSVQQHILPKFLTTEKAMIFGHLAPDIPHRDKIVQLFRTQTSGDALIKMSVFPVLIAYESNSVAGAAELNDAYVKSLASEVQKLREYFSDKAKDLPLRFQLILVPMGKKSAVVESFDQKLVPWL